MNILKSAAWLQITAGQGPKECAWVVAQTCKKILQDAENKKIKVQLVEWLAYEKMYRNQSVIKPDSYRSILLRIEGDKASLFASEWEGTIKWSGQSHYRPNHKRCNWFVGVKVVEANNGAELSIAQLQREITTETMRASGPGGQHVNKTCSAIRLKHIPTGITVRVENDRSQHRNRQIALERLFLLLQTLNKNEAKEIERDRWLSHFQVQRSGAKRVFSGENFKEI